MPLWRVAVLVLACVTLLPAGCAKGKSAFTAGKKAENLQDYDTALTQYEQALKADPLNAQYKQRVVRMRFEASQSHVQKGQKLRGQGEHEAALVQFEQAIAVDPSSPIAEQELRRTTEMIEAKKTAAQGAGQGAKKREEPDLLEEPVDLVISSREPINLKLANDARVVFQTIGKLVGINVIFDPDFPPRRISTELVGVSFEEALDLVAVQSKAFWKAVSKNAILVFPDQAQKRKEQEEQVMRTFYLSNALLPQDLAEIVTGLRQMLDLRHLQQVSGQNAIVIRDTPDKLILAEKFIRDIDKSKPEVLVDVSVLQARRDRARNLGIQPGSRTVLAFTPRNSLGGAGGTGIGSITLNNLSRISSSDYSLTLPGAVGVALLTDSTTKIIQNPEIRVADGQSARLRVGDRVPVATGSFQVGVGGSAGSPLVNTQFQYQDVGVNIDISPRVHPNREISLKVAVEVSSVTGRVNIGGIEQPIISQRRIEHDIRLREGEVSVLGGLVERTETKSHSGLPGASRIPLLHYLFSGETVDMNENEVLIVLMPRIVRLPEITEANLRPVSVGTEGNIQVRRKQKASPPPAPQQPPAHQPPVPAAAPTSASVTQATSGPRLHLEPLSTTLNPGDTATIAAVVEEIHDLFSATLTLEYDPAAISVEEVRHGGFLSGGTQQVAIVQRIDKDRGQAIIFTTRQPNTPGIDGNGTLVGILVRRIGKGIASLRVSQATVRDSQQQAITLDLTEARTQVQ